MCKEKKWALGFGQCPYGVKYREVLRVSRRGSGVLWCSWRVFLTILGVVDSMSAMSDSLVENIDAKKLYMTGEAGELIGLSSKQVGRLADAGYFPNARRKSPQPGSPRVIPGSDLIAYLRDLSK